MSEKSPKIPETINTPEGLPPRDEAINAIRSEISALQNRLNEAEEKVRTPGVTASANDIIKARAHLRDVRQNDEPRLNSLVELWDNLGGSKLIEAEEAAAALD